MNKKRTLRSSKKRQSKLRRVNKSKLRRKNLNKNRRRRNYRSKRGGAGETPTECPTPPPSRSTKNFIEQTFRSGPAVMNRNSEGPVKHIKFESPINNNSGYTILEKVEALAYRFMPDIIQKYKTITTPDKERIHKNLISTINVLFSEEEINKIFLEKTTKLGDVLKGKGYTF